MPRALSFDRPRWRILPALTIPAKASSCSAIGVSSSACVKAALVEARRVRAPCHRSVGEMDLVEVDIVGLQPLQALVDGFLDLPAIDPSRPLIVAEPVIGRAADHLGGEDHLVAIAARLKPSADDPLGRALRLRRGRDRIELGRVEEVHALVERVIHLLMPLGLRVLLTPGHRARADRRDLEIGAAETAVFHGEKLR